MCENDCAAYRLMCNERKSTSYYDDLQSRLRRKNLPIFTPKEVVIHNSPDDCWVCFLGIVRDVTPLVLKHSDTREIKPILAFAGKDISNWFDSRTGDILHHIHPVTGVRVPYTPYGPIPDVLPQVPTSAWEPLDHNAWWFDPSLVVGYLTTNARPIRILNTLTSEEVTIEVCSEDSLERILERYLLFNTYGCGYTWKYETRVLDMSLTLDENQIPDPRPRLRKVHLPDNTYIPCLMLYFNDDHAQ